jgi:aspartyl/asparaginyl-tRNA synthetase
VDITGTITKAPEKIESTSQSDVEIQISSFFVVSAAEPYPLLIEDAARPKSILTAQVCSHPQYAKSTMYITKDDNVSF